MTKGTLIDRAFILKKAAPFNDLDLELLLAIADKLEMINIKAEQVLFQKGEEGLFMYFILHGDIQIENDKGTVIDTLSETNYFGDEALFRNKEHEYTAKAIRDSVLLTLSHTNLLNIISECPSVGLGFLKQYAEQVCYRKKGERIDS